MLDLDKLDLHIEYFYDRASISEQIEGDFTIIEASYGKIFNFKVQNYGKMKTDREKASLGGFYRSREPTNIP